MWGSWLSGPGSLAEAAGIDLGYPGQRLGLPKDGPNSVASQTRRIGAVFIDWFLAQLIARLIVGGDDMRDVAWTTMAVFAVMNIALITTAGAGFGGRLLGLRVARLDGANPPLVSVLLRTLAMVLVIPALVWDRDQRGLHDRAANTVVVRR